MQISHGLPRQLLFIVRFESVNDIQGFNSRNWEILLKQIGAWMCTKVDKFHSSIQKFDILATDACSNSMKAIAQ